MLRDQAEETMDMEVIEEADIEELNQDSIRGYRNSHKSFKPGHPFERLDDKEYLRVIGAAGFSKDDKKLHPTAAGMLMFGNEYDIVRYFPDYFWITGRTRIRCSDGRTGFNHRLANGREMYSTFIFVYTISLRRISRCHFGWRAVFGWMIRRFTGR